MTKMSKTQRMAVLDFHNGVTAKRHTFLASSRTIDIMVREGWAKRPGDMRKRTAATLPPSARRIAYVTMAGLIAAGVDMDAIHAEALSENMDRLNARAMDEQRALYRDRDHAEALIENFLRQPHMVRAMEIGAAERQRAIEAAGLAASDNRDEIGAPRTQRFHALFKITRSWPAALDVLHAEALDQHHA